MREPRYDILADIQDAIERAKQGKLALYWQRAIQREYRCKKVTPAEQQAYEQLQSVLSEVPQWSDDEELRSEIEEIGGRVRFCRFWNEHYSMVQLTEDRNGKYSAAYVLDAETTPDVRKEAALQAQKELADRMQAWGVSLLETPVPEQMKYDSLAEAASHLMQVLNDPEHITGSNASRRDAQPALGNADQRGLGRSPTSVLQRKISRCIYVCTACHNGVGSEKLTASELYRCPNLSYNEDVLRERSIA